MNRILLAATALVFTACGGGVAADVAGTFVGDIVVSTGVTENDYTITVDDVGANTIEISGADFTTFEVDLMGVSGVITQALDETDTTLSFDEEDGELDFARSGDEDITFSGFMQ